MSKSGTANESGFLVQVHSINVLSFYLFIFYHCHLMKVALERKIPKDQPRHSEPESPVLEIWKFSFIELCLETTVLKI